MHSAVSRKGRATRCMLSPDASTATSSRCRTSCTHVNPIARISTTPLSDANNCSSRGPQMSSTSSAVSSTCRSPPLSDAASSASCVARRA